MKSVQQDDHYGVYQPEVLSFVKAANDLAGWLEQPPATGRQLVGEALVLLSEVYSRVHSIAPREPVYEEGIEREVTEQEWAAVYQGIARVLGPANAYLRVAGAGEYDRSDLVPHTVSEDLADIYQELRDFIAVYSSGSEDLMNDALLQVTEAFREHWGKKLLLALSALHDVLVAGDDFILPDADQDIQDQTPDRHGFFSRFQDQAGEDY
ncbi:MAG: DUF5063 domain-containing protein [Bacteroidota bacterium]